MAALDRIPRLLQFNYESTVTYNEDGFSVLSVKGVLEIPLTRDPTQPTRTFLQTADHFRGEIERRVMSGIDLSRFQVTRRNFNLSRDKRFLYWDFQAEEKSYMDFPVGCTTARGNYSVRPSKAGLGLCSWICSLRCTYTVAMNQPRRVAWLSFLALLRERMRHGQNGVGPLEDPKQQRKKGVGPTDLIGVVVIADVFNYFNKLFNAQGEEQKKKGLKRRTLLIDFNIDEGLYKDSKTITFSASWKLMTTFSHILLASGIWRKVEGRNRTLWATSIQSVSGAQSWLANMMDPDIVVDFGGGDAPTVPFSNL